MSQVLKARRKRDVGGVGRETTPWTYPPWMTTTHTTTPRPHYPRTTRHPLTPVINIILDLLDTMDVLMCQWLKLADTELDFMHVFRGFKSERELEEYFLQQATDNEVLVLASMFHVLKHFIRYQAYNKYIIHVYC